MMTVIYALAVCLAGAPQCSQISPPGAGPQVCEKYRPEFVAEWNAAHPGGEQPDIRCFKSVLDWTDVTK